MEAPLLPPPPPINLSNILTTIVLILLVFVLILLRVIVNVSTDEVLVDFPGTQRQSLKQNCDIETVYSVEDSQCESICSQPGIFVSKNGACVNIMTFSQDAVENTCDPKSGVLAYLIGDPQFGKTKLLCLSIDQGVQPDNVSDPNTLCSGGGTININYVDSYPQLSSCACPYGTVLALIPNTSTIRQRGICVNKNLQRIYNFNNLLYNNDL